MSCWSFRPFATFTSWYRVMPSAMMLMQRCNAARWRWLKLWVILMTAGVFRIRSRSPAVAVGDNRGYRSLENCCASFVPATTWINRFENCCLSMNSMCLSSSMVSAVRHSR